MSLMIVLNSREQDRTYFCPGAGDEHGFCHARENVITDHATSAIKTPPAIAALIECAAASFEVDRNASREYLFRAYALLRASRPLARPHRHAVDSRCGKRIASLTT